MEATFRRPEKERLPEKNKMQEEGEIEGGKEISSFMFDEDDDKQIVYAIIGPKDEKETKDGVRVGLIQPHLSRR